MADSNFLIDISALYRNVQKYFDKTMAKYDIGSGQLTFLFLINEQEGITMNEVSRYGEVDKGTTTKSIQKLIEQGYVQARVDENDRRVKRLYTTERALEIMNELYELRNECRTKLAVETDIERFESLLSKVTSNSRMYLNPEPLYSGIRIAGLQKMTMLDYPGKVAATIFTGGCNFKCPYCHNRDLVFVPGSYEFFDPDEVLSYLEKRKGILDGVCITGGEPLIQDDLEGFIKEIRKIGYLVKLDTNGYFPDRLKELCEAGLIDYVAMDIKNSPDRYYETVGLNQDVFRMEPIEASVEYLKHSRIEHEFRTTVVREFHEAEDLVAIAKWIQGSPHYYLQQYTDSGNVIQPGWSAYTSEEMKELLAQVQVYVPAAELRGIKEG
ncbi:MAG: anaerobic ribonucleoside-triphosphate reductase activating protein [Solobacterium sp.]|nr:anaerobic ribonucleoside-triphosphate reductase activating protein [Solobacterium sp.]